MAKQSALFAQMQANMRAAAQRARDKEDEISLAEQAAIAAAANGSTVQEEQQATLPIISEPKNIHTSEVTPDDDRRMRSLSEVAVKLAHVLIKSHGFVNLAHVNMQVNNRNVPYETIRTALKRLIKENFFSYRGVGNYGTLKGMRYTLDPVVIDLFLRVHNSSAEQNYISDNQIVSMPVQKTMPILSHPELKPWVDFGLSERQINIWKEEFSLETELLVQYLKWCAFDVKNNHKDNPVKNMANYKLCFY